jgi:RecA-family ATPase
MTQEFNLAFTNLPKISQADCVRWVGIDPPEQKFTVAGLVPEGMTTLLVGHGGSGKSILIQLALSCCPIGKPFLGRNVLGGDTAGVFAEDPEAVLHIRQKRINDALGIDMEPLAGRLYIQSYAGMPALLWQDEAPTEFLSDLERELGRIDELRLCVLDNVALLFGGNESDRIEVTAFVNALNGMADRLQIGLILTTHASKSQDGSALRAASGSTAWINACRSVLELKQAEGGDPPSLTLIKANHAVTGDKIELEWRDGVLMSAQMDTPTVANIKRANAENMFLELIDRLTTQGREVSPKSNAISYAPKVMVRMPDRDNLKRRDLEIAMEDLFARGKIVVEQYGPPSRQKTRIIRANHEKQGLPSGGVSH